MKKLMTIAALLASPFAFAENSNPPPIPARAYTACSGKTQGETVSDGRMEGTCEYSPDGQLALRPSGGPPNGAPPNGAPPDGAPPTEGAAGASVVPPAYGAQ